MIDWLLQVNNEPGKKRLQEMAIALRFETFNFLVLNPSLQCKEREAVGRVRFYI
jgi:hypothetical protein